MGKNPNPARTNRIRTQVLPKTEPYPVKNRTEPELKCHGSYSVLSLTEIVCTFTHFTVNEAFHFT